MASSVPLQIAETIQTAHINRNPSAQHDMNPSTAASKKEPVTLEQPQKQQQQQQQQQPFHDSKDSQSVGGRHDDVWTDDEDLEELEEEEEDIPYSVLRPVRRKAQLPPIPDLRYEQSYLHSIRNADTWWKVLWITTRDQLMMPFAQGILYNLGICGWQHWNRNVQLSGSSIGARVRRWWWGVNNWPIPGETGGKKRAGGWR